MRPVVVPMMQLLHLKLKLMPVVCIKLHICSSVTVSGLLIVVSRSGQVYVIIVSKVLVLVCSCNNVRRDIVML